MNFSKFRHIWAQFLLFAFFFYGVQSKNCGGVLQATSGTVEHALKDNSTRCLWIIQLPVTSSVIRLHLYTIPASSQLSLYPQEGHVAGQTTVLPIALTNANESSILTMNSSSMVVVWAPTNGSEIEVGSKVTFKWEEVQDQGQLQGQGGVNFVEDQEGTFLWERAGESQQTLLWVLNSENSDWSENAVELNTVTDFEYCDLSDPCLCSYLGVYKVEDGFLRQVISECGTFSNRTFSGLERPLLALGFVNPKYQNGRNFVSLRWRSEETNEATTTTTEATPTCPSASDHPKSCDEIQGTSSQICTIYPFGPEEKSVEVLCDFETDGGGWTTFQKRTSGPREQFYRGWDEYQEGFGSLEGNFWTGLETIHALTKDLDQELRIDMWDSGLFEYYAYAVYSNFSVSNSEDFYRLSLGRYSGTAGDSFSDLNGMRFTTVDEDNDIESNNCAEIRRGSWWYKDCGASNLNGLYYEKGEEQNPPYTGIFWYSLSDSARSLLQTQMKVRKIRQN